MKTVPGVEEDSRGEGKQRCVGIVPVFSARSAGPLNTQFTEYLLELSTDFDYH